MNIFVVSSTSLSTHDLIDILSSRGPREWSVRAAEPDTIAPLVAESHAAGTTPFVILDARSGDGPTHAAGACRRLRADVGDASLIAIVPTSRTGNVAAVLEGGADDAVAAPFDEVELVARIRAVARRGGRHDRAEPATGPLVILRRARSVSVHGRPVTLTSLEFDLLCYLDDRRARPVTTTEIALHVHGTTYQDGGVVRQLVHKLRKKLGDDVAIVTLRGKGYCLAHPAPAGSLGDKK